MPQAALFIGAYLFEALGAAEIGALTIAGTSLAEIVGSVVIAAGLQIGSSLIFGGGGAGFTPESQKANVKQPVAPRRKFYGRVKIGGVYAFRKAKDGKLYLIVMLGDGEFSAFVEHWLDDVQVTLDGSGFVQEPQFTSGGTKRVKLGPQVGSSSQAAHADMVSGWPDVWTTDHRLRGIANTLLVLQTTPAADFTGVYPQGIPAYTTVVETAKVWDPRL